MSEITPIKRSPELQPLSREHHDGLLFVWKLRQGLKKNVAVERMASFVAWYWKNHIRTHFFQEEKVLLPVINPNPLTERMKAEHEHIRELILEIDKEAIREHFFELAILIEKHIRFEERELFQYVESELDAHQLHSVQEQLEDHSIQNCEWTDEFWK